MDASPHQLALGLAIGVFVGFLPCMGVQTWVALPIAFLLGGNKPLAVAGVWISNPVTFVPFYYLCYRVGMQVAPPETVLNFEEFSQVLRNVDLAGMLEMTWALMVPLTVGGVVLGFPSALLTYGMLHRYLTRRRGNETGKADRSRGGTQG